MSQLQLHREPTTTLKYLNLNKVLETGTKMSSDSDNENENNHSPIKNVPTPKPRTVFETKISAKPAEEDEESVSSGSTKVSKSSSKTSYSMMKFLFPRPNPRKPKLPPKENRRSQNRDSEPKPLRRKNRIRPAGSRSSSQRESLEETQSKGLSNSRESLEEYSKEEEATRKGSMNSGQKGTPSRPAPPKPFRIKTLKQLQEIAQRAEDCEENARRDSANNNHVKAAKKYERCLNYIDDVLETPLGRLNLSASDETLAAELMQDMKLLRKSVLQGFSDTQCSQTLPECKDDIPPESPPSYNEVIKASIRPFNSPTQDEMASLEPNQPPSTLIDLSDSKVDRVKSLANKPLPPVPVRPQSSNTKPESSVRQPVAPVAQSLTCQPHQFNDFNGEQLSVRPKQFKIPELTPKVKAQSRNVIMPPDVVLKKNHNNAEDTPSKGTFTEENKDPFDNQLSNESVMSNLSEASFVTAKSSPMPRNGNSDFSISQQNSEMGTENLPPVLDPFSFEDPFENTPTYAGDPYFTLQKIEIKNKPHTPLKMEVSFLPDQSYHTEVFDQKDDRNPFKNDFSKYESLSGEFVDNKKFRNAIDAQKPTCNDQFRLLNEEFRSKFSEPVITSNNFEDSKDTQKGKSENTKQNDNRFELSSSFTDNDPFPTLSRKHKHYQSDMNITKTKAKQTAPKNKKLRKTKQISRSNESVLLMFDPLIPEELSENDDQDIEKGDFPPMFSTPKRLNTDITFDDNCSVDELDQPRDTILVDFNDLSISEHKSNDQRENNQQMNTNNDVPNVQRSKSENFNSNDHKSDQKKEFRKSLYPVLNIETNSNEEETVYTPIRKPPPVPRNSAYSPTAKPRKFSLDSSNSMNSSNIKPDFQTDFTKEKLASKFSIEENDQVIVGNSSFYKLSPIDEDSSPTQITEVIISSNKNDKREPTKPTPPTKPPPPTKTSPPTKPSPPTKQPPPTYIRATNSKEEESDRKHPPLTRISIRKGSEDSKPKENGSKDHKPNEGRSKDSNPPWQEVFKVADAVKLFFLGDSDVSSPFNRQSISVLRKGWANNVENHAEARVEIGGELFVLSLQAKTTQVLQDTNGDYVIQSADGVFVCVSPCDTMRRSNVGALDKTLEIYCNLWRENQRAKLPSDMENAAANMRKTVMEKAPSVAKATNVMKSNSMRAFRKIRGAMGITPETEKKQELPSEFIALKQASDKIRAARNTKTILYF